MRLSFRRASSFRGGSSCAGCGRGRSAGRDGRAGPVEAMRRIAGARTWDRLPIRQPKIANSRKSPPLRRDFLRRFLLSARSLPAGDGLPAGRDPSARTAMARTAQRPCGAFSCGFPRVSAPGEKKGQLNRRFFWSFHFSCVLLHHFLGKEGVTSSSLVNSSRNRSKPFETIRTALRIPYRPFPLILSAGSACPNSGPNSLLADASDRTSEQYASAAIAPAGSSRAVPAGRIAVFRPADFPNPPFFAPK